MPGKGVRKWTLGSDVLNDLLLHINRKQNTRIKFVLQPEECGQTGVSGHCALCRVAMVKSRELGIVKAGLNVTELTIPNLLSKKKHATMVHVQVIVLFNNNAITTKYDIYCKTPLYIL